MTSGNRHLYPSIFTATLLIACMAIATASAQTFNPQQPPNFGDFNGTRPDFQGGIDNFNGSQGFPGGMGPGGDFNGTMGRPGGGNFTMPDFADFSGAPQYDPNNLGVPGEVNGSQIDYTFIIAAVIVVAVVVSVATVMLVRRKNAGKSAPTPSSAAEENFDF